ncbi:hypothetical protein COO60DRAFT_1501791, partial [Scenedesmus sp. NREL 46B-D3]
LTLLGTAVTKALVVQAAVPLPGAVPGKQSCACCVHIMFLACCECVEAACRVSRRQGQGPVEPGALLWGRAEQGRLLPRSCSS